MWDTADIPKWFFYIFFQQTTFLFGDIHLPKIVSSRWELFSLMAFVLFFLFLQKNVVFLALKSSKVYKTKLFESISYK